MILYHFTTIRLIRPDMTPGEAILPPEGLVTSKADDWVPAAVWLTADPKPGRATPETNCVRITVKIPKADRKLLPFSRLQVSRIVLPKLAPDLQERARRDWWLYRGVVPLERWTALELIEDQEPWWLSD
jgi:hypothetical protein